MTKVHLTQAERSRCCVPGKGKTARRCEYVVKSIPLAAGKEIVNAYHYAGTKATTAVYTHGLIRCSDQKVVGVAMWLPPTKGAAATVDPEQPHSVLNLMRLAVAPSEPKNATSLLLGQSIRQVRQGNRAREKAGKRTYRTLLTYADEREGHTGKIYRATNWKYLGKTTPERIFLDAEGKRVPKKSTRNRTKAELEALGARPAGRSVKHKFALTLDGKKGVKRLQALIRSRYEMKG